VSTVVIAGGSGFLGGALTPRLAREHSVIVLSRSKPRSAPKEGDRVRAVQWNPDGTLGDWAKAIDGTDAIVNLAGAGIADRRWTEARKRELIDSRVKSTESLVQAVLSATNPPKTFIQQSGVGYYGAYDDGPVVEESSPPGHDFLGEMAVQWEAAAKPVEPIGTRLVTVRTGIVLAKHGGALKKMMLPFHFFVGGPIGSGRQYMSWIHLDDWTGMIAWAIRMRLVTGTINATAPNPVPNWEFCRALGRAMRRPSWAPVPGFVLKAMFGEMGEVALLKGQRAVPARANELKFAFRYQEIRAAFAAIFGRRN
jgi:uncharacterized protein (TIGR01777 family)